MQSRDASKAETHQNKRPREKKKKRGTFLFHIHAAEKSRHAAGDWAGHEELLIMTKDFSHNRFFFFFFPSSLLSTVCARLKETFLPPQQPWNPWTRKRFVRFHEHVNSAAGENCAGSDDGAEAVALKCHSGSAGNLETRCKHRVKSQGGRRAHQRGTKWMLPVRHSRYEEPLRWLIISILE